MTLRSIVKTDLQLPSISSQHMMMKNIFLLWAFFFSALLSAEHVFSKEIKPEAELFWRAKPKLLNQIINERALVVSVKSVSAQNKKKDLVMVGGGLVNVSAQNAFEGAKNYERLMLVSDYIREVKINPEQKTIYVHTEAFQYHSRMTMRVTEDDSDKKIRRIEFQVIKGHFVGMTGVFTFEDFTAQQTLMGFVAHYEYEKLPMPQFFVEFGLEFVLKIVAQKMRTLLEKDFAL